MVVDAGVHGRASSGFGDRTLGVFAHHAGVKTSRDFVITIEVQLFWCTTLMNIKNSPADMMTFIEEV